MKNLSSIILLLIIANTSFGQPSFAPNNISKAKEDLPKNIKRITQYEGDYLLNIREYDKNSNQVFSHYKQYVSEYWKDKYLTMVTAEVCNDDGLVVRSYNLHSNAGLSIWYNEYDSLGNNIRIYKKDNQYEQDDKLINKNPYEYISEIKSNNDLLNHPKIQEIESTSKKYLLVERIYNESGDMVVQLSYDSKGDTTVIQKYEYDENHNSVYFYNEWKGQSNIWWEYYFEYEKNANLLERKDSLTSKKAEPIQSVRLDFDNREKRKRVSSITFYKYDDKSRLISQLEYSDGVLESKYTYEYNDKDQVTKRLAYLYDENNMVSQDTYEYNQEGYVVRHIEENYRTGEKKVREYKYRYVYEYYE